MSTHRNTIVLFALLQALTFSLPAQDAEVRRHLEPLVADYRSYNLPFPPADARLVMREDHSGTFNGDRRTDYELAFLIGEGKQPKTVQFWLGCDPITIATDRSVVEVDPTEDAAERTHESERSHPLVRFPTYPDLAMAIQCHDRGWHALAGRLLERSRRRLYTDVFHRPQRSAIDDRKGVAQLAWNYWCNQFAVLTDGRATAVDQLQRLIEGPFQLNSKANRTIVADMELTLKRSDVEPGTLEAAIESLLEFEGKRRWSIQLGSSPWCRRHNRRILEEHAQRHPKFRKLLDAGMDAVPILIQHLDDYRLTRCLARESVGDYTWHVRVSDLIRILLNGYEPDGFAYDLRRSEGRGASLDKAHVLSWWEKTQRSTPLVGLLKDPSFANPPGPSDLQPDEARIRKTNHKDDVAHQDIEAFFDAVDDGNVETIRVLLTKYPSLANCTTNDIGWPPLHSAALNEHVQAAQALLQAKAMVNALDPDGNTALFYVGSGEMAKLLLSHGADAKHRAPGSVHTILHCAAERGDADVVEALLDAGEKLEFDDAVLLGRTEIVVSMLKDRPWLARRPNISLRKAARRGYLAVCQVLLEHGADPNDADPDSFAGPSGYTALTAAVVNGHDKIAKLLFEYGADPNVSTGDKVGTSLIEFVAAQRDPQLLKLLLQNGADVHRSGWLSLDLGVTALHIVTGIDLEKNRCGSRRRTDSRITEPPDQHVRDLECVRLLLEYGVDPNTRNEHGATPLLFAALAGNREICDLLIENGATLDIGSSLLLGRMDEVERLIDKAGTGKKLNDGPLRRPILHWAIMAGHLGTTQRLLQLGADPNRKAPAISISLPGLVVTVSCPQCQYETPLDLAARGGHEEIARHLLDRGAYLAGNAIGETPTAIRYACESGKESLVKLLLEHGAAVNVHDTSLFSAAFGHDSILKMLLDQVDPKELTNEAGTKLLADAVHENGLSAAHMLLQRGAKPDIFTASALGRVDDVRALLDANPELIHAVQTTSPNRSAIELAVQNGHTQVLELILSRGAPLTSPAGQHDTLLHLAAAHGQWEVIEFFVNRGLNLDIRGTRGATLLHAASRGAQPQIVRILLSRGLNAQDTDSALVTPLHAVAGRVDAGPTEHQRELEVVRLLIDANGNIHACDDDGDTPLHKAARCGNVSMVQHLIRAGANVHARNRRKETPLQSAKRSPFQEPPKTLIALLEQFDVNP